MAFDLASLPGDRRVRVRFTTGVMVLGLLGRTTINRGATEMIVDKEFYDRVCATLVATEANPERPISLAEILETLP